MAELMKLIDNFIEIYNNDVKQRDKEWYKLMGTTIGGSEIAAIMGLSPYSSFYKIVESKIEICKGIKQVNDTISCHWGTVFENIIQSVVEIDLGNEIKGNNICIQKYEGHRTSPDGYTVAHFYYDNGIYHLWTTDKPKEIISLSLIVLIEFKCPITRRVTGNIPIYYKPQVLSGLSVSPLAHKGLFIDSIFKKCSIDQLGNNPYYDLSFHKKILNSNPLAWGVLSIYVSLDKITDNIKEIYSEYFGTDFNYEFDNIIDLGNANSDIFNKVLLLIIENQLLITTSTVQFFDGRGDEKNINIENINNHKLFALLPWKLFDLIYVIIDKELDFLDKIYPIITKVHELVKYSIDNDNNNNENNEYYQSSIDNLKILKLCELIY